MKMNHGRIRGTNRDEERIVQRSHLGRAGLLWHVNGGKIIELHRDWATIDRPANRPQSTFYRRNVDQAKIAP